MRRLRPGRAATPPDLRPALLSVVALLFLLLPFLLLTTSIQKLTGLDLGLAASAGELQPLPPGRVEAVEIHLDSKRLLLRAAVRTLDVTASRGDVTWSEQRLPHLPTGPDLAGLQRALRSLRQLDPERQRALVVPADDVPTARLVALLDAARESAGEPLFPDLVLGGSELSSRPGDGQEPSP